MRLTICCFSLASQEGRLFRALSIEHYRPIPEPHYYGCSVYFGFEPNSNFGAFSRLSREIVMRKWLMENTTSLICLTDCSVIFSEQDDAERCYEAFRD